MDNELTKLTADCLLFVFFMKLLTFIDQTAMPMSATEAPLSCMKMDFIKPLGRQNKTSVSEFVLLGFSVDPTKQTILFALGLLIFVLTLAGNLTIITLIWIDQCLQTPMYFLLGYLSFIEICYTSTTVPKMLWDLLLGDKTISFIGCALQMYFFVTLGSMECVLLSAMAYDRYAAICHPLRYTILMSQKTCWGFLASSWAIGNINSIVNTALVFSLDFCHSNEIDHFFCDIPPLLQLSCSDTLDSQMMTFTISGSIMIVAFCLILLSYILIVSSVLKIRTAQGRIKAFSTYASHLTVVSIFYGTLMYMYIRPSSSHSMEQDRLVAVLYVIITPMLNPLIYSFRSKEVLGAVRRVLSKNRWLSNSRDHMEALRWWIKIPRKKALTETHRILACLKWRHECSSKKEDLIAGDWLSQQNS
uniref:olfactory receptor 5F1-like n=1 Tax=Euleptes europaea TaxID=460621 RepID=UPI0025421E2A|nr:olfactory receptor 5F1-like [Euleptes europaea]